MSILSSPKLSQEALIEGFESVRGARQIALEVLEISKLAKQVYMEMIDDCLKYPEEGE